MRKYYDTADDRGFRLILYIAVILLALIFLISAIRIAKNSSKKEPDFKLVYAEVETTIVATNSPTAVPTEQPTDLPLTSLGVCRITAYCACSACCGKSDGITASGTKATEGRTIAVDPNIIPYGTKVVINGHTYIAEDCGGAIDNTDIDIFMDSHQEALIYGVQYAEVFVYE